MKSPWKMLTSIECRLVTESPLYYLCLLQDASLFCQSPDITAIKNNTQVSTGSD